ncbi:hypothetical protein [Ferruginibacter albus]|uniref:hypothetical protein n=1 Tax=Ferruginibacter albus TaxID=2875540 RepID=UPI001CC354DC|nr:hypothetical protein [Ferruginibacter albus]UAY52483.1 hypothetical protein K9M53_02045 [Ferruginibacter albus]
MKKLIVIFSLFLLLGANAFSQEMKENGIIYITHPYIDMVNNSMNAYVKQDNAAFGKIYSDTAKFWASGMDKPIGIADAIKMWSTDFKFYDSIKVLTVGYPDYLHYKDHDSKIVQSWWTWVGKSKRTGATVKVDFVQFDGFNSAGKIDFEGMYGDFSKMEKEK